MPSRRYPSTFAAASSQGFKSGSRRSRRVGTPESRSCRFATARSMRSEISSLIRRTVVKASGWQRGTPIGGAIRHVLPGPRTPARRASSGDRRRSCWRVGAARRARESFHQPPFPCSRESRYSLARWTSKRAAATHNWALWSSADRSGGLAGTTGSTRRSSACRRGPTSGPAVKPGRACAHPGRVEFARLVDRPLWRACRSLRDPSVLLCLGLDRRCAGG
jgi:hypothetical protein